MSKIRTDVKNIFKITRLEYRLWEAEKENNTKSAIIEELKHIFVYIILIFGKNWQIFSSTFTSFQSGPKFPNCTYTKLPKIYMKSWVSQFPWALALAF